MTSDNPGILARRFERGVAAFFAYGRTAPILISLRPQGQRVLGLRLRVPPDAKPGEVIHIDLAQRDAFGKNVLGGIAIEIRVRG